VIVLRALGNAEIDTGVATLTPSQEIVFAAALYLILERGKRVSRTRLASLLWPQVVEKTRAHRLRQALLQLKKLGFIVKADRHSLQYIQHDIQTDIAELPSMGADTLAMHPCLEFLPSYAPTFSEVFRDWVDGQREAAHAHVTSHLVTQLNTARTRGDWLTCDKFARQCRSLDPFNESAVLAQAEACAMRGSKTQAIEILDRYLLDVGSDNQDLKLPASVLRRRITERLPERAVITVRECAFVGRDREMQMLTLQLLSARGGVGGARLIRGEAGIGKSRLASELAQFAGLEGVQTTRTRCRRSDVDRPLSVFVDLVPQLSELRGALGCSQDTIAVLKRLTEFDRRVSVSLSSIDDSMIAYAKTRAALIDLFDAIADEQCVLIVVDDVQWLDAPSASLLAELLLWAKSKKLLFVLTERPESGYLTRRASLDDLNILTLDPLDHRFAEEIIAETLKDSSRPTSRELVQRLLSVGEGNPFFLQELGNHWLETGKQRGSPPSITAIIDDRLSRLSNEALQVLQACAVLGVNATIERAERVLEYKSHVLLSAVQELSAAGMLSTDSRPSADSTEQLSVRHDLVSTAALKRLAKAPFAFLHRRAGMVLQRETLGDGARTAALWACAFHWRNAGDRQRAFGVARSCAEHLLEVGLPQDAANAFERVLEYCVTDEQRLLVFSRLALTLQISGQWEHSKEILRKSRQLQAKTAPNTSTHDEVEYALNEASWRVSLENSALLDDLRACARSQDASVGHRVACALLGLKVATELNQIDAMQDLYTVIGPLLANSQIAPLTRFEVEMIYHSICGDIRTAEHATDRLLQATREERDALTLSRALGNIGVAYRLAGRQNDAEAIFLEVLDHSLEHGFVSRTTFATLSLVRLYLAAGDVQQARNAMNKLEAFSAVDQDLNCAADRLYLLARVALEEGRIEEASQRYAAVAAQSSPTQSVNRRAADLALGVRIGIRAKVPRETLRSMVAELETAHLRNRSSGWQDFEAHALALGLRHCEQSEKGLRLLVEYVTRYRREKWPLPQTLTALLQDLGDSYAVSATRRTEPLSGVV